LLIADSGVSSSSGKLFFGKTYAGKILDVIYECVFAKIVLPLLRAVTAYTALFHM
jgi:hypothetical protein